MIRRRRSRCSSRPRSATRVTSGSTTTWARSWRGYPRGVRMRCVTTPRRGRCNRSRRITWATCSIGWDEARTRSPPFVRWSRCGPGKARNIGCLGTILLGRQQREEGLKTLDQAIAAARANIERRPGDAGEYHLLGYLLAARGDPDGAIAAYRESLRIEPGHTGALTNLVTMLRNWGDQDGIIAVLRTAIRAGPDHAWLHEALGAALQAKGDPDGAIAEIREAIRLNPDDQAYHKQLSALLKSRRDSTPPPSP